MYELEEHTGFSQTDISTVCDVSVIYIHDIYHGNVDVRGSTILKIAKEVYGLEDYEFMQEGYFPEHIKVKKGYSRPKKKKNDSPASPGGDSEPSGGAPE